jgi:hypothetical protein
MTQLERTTDDISHASDSVSFTHASSVVPIRGNVYIPPDNPGYEVDVQTTLQDWYYILNEATTPPQLYYGPNPNSVNLTNDGYNFWATK